MKNLLKRTNLLISLFIAVCFILLSFRGFPLLEGMERIIYGIHMRLDLPGAGGDNKIAIVNIDEKSIKQLGPWPWPRQLIAEMIGILKANGAKLIGLDLLFTHKEQNQGLVEMRKLIEIVSQRQEESVEKDAYKWVLENLNKIEKRLDSDKTLSQIVRESGNIVLPVLGKFGQYDTDLVIPPDSYLQKSMLKSVYSDRNLADRSSVNQLSAPFSEMAEYARGLGHINPSPNIKMVGQAHLPFINYRGHTIPSMPLRLALDYMNKYPEQVVIQNRQINFDQTTIPTMDGEIFVKFKGAKKSFPYYSFVDILKVKKVPAVFEDKIVLVGFTAEEEGAAIDTPVDPEMPRVELTANVIEGLMAGRFIKRPGTMAYLEAIIVLILTIGFAFLLPQWDYFSRSAVVGAALLFVFFAGVALFTAFDIWFKVSYICASLIITHLVFWVKDIIASEKSLVLSSRESIETNRMLGLSFQSQGLLDLAFEKFRKCPLDDAMKDVVYNLGLDFERKRMVNKAISVYEYIHRAGAGFRDLDQRLPKLKAMAGEMSFAGQRGKTEHKITIAEELGTKPTVGRYEILAELGQGAMGVLYKARDPKINREIAIKTIRFSDDFDEKQVIDVKERFFKEAELAGKLSHPSIISIFDVGEDYELTYMAMELLDGKDLENFCRKNKLLPLRRIIDVVAETAEALDYAHRQGIVHRDIKPANIMLLRNGHVKVTDFGIAKAVSSSQTKSGIILGTPNYMSPEQINGSEIDGRSDIFSLGVVFYQLLTGQLPFRGKTLTELLYQITQVIHPSPKAVNPRVIKPCEQLINKILKKDPEHRFQRAGDLAKYLRTLGEKLDEQKAAKGGTK
ncbi:MAG: serine/threonine-protein kinase [Thermodesulfobacteriota bacterium]|nr:serine/threonine-protein kinase [Thermodesulfobacteriota bacterium]